jgi:hypothetical protein
MDEKTRLRRMGAGAGITLVMTVIAGWQFGSLAVPLALPLRLQFRAVRRALLLIECHLPHRLGGRGRRVARRGLCSLTQLALLVCLRYGLEPRRLQLRERLRPLGRLCLDLLDPLHQLITPVRHQRQLHVLIRLLLSKVVRSLRLVDGLSLVALLLRLELASPGARLGGALPSSICRQRHLRVRGA